MRMGTARHKHNSKPKIKVMIKNKIDHYERDTLPGTRLYYEDIILLKPKGEYLCGYARCWHEYEGEIISICALRNFKMCDHTNYLFRKVEEDCPRFYRFDCRTQRRNI